MRRVRRKFAEASSISIISLLDILTILLVFLIKNVSIESQRLTAPVNMTLPTTITNQELMDNGLAVLVKVYPDKILVGPDNIYAGKPDELITVADLREKIFDFMKHEATQINLRNASNKTNFKPCLLIQADKQIPCQYITLLIKIAAGASISDVYFATIQDEHWLQASARQIY